MMKKILIPQDKANHFVYGFLIFEFFSLFFTEITCLFIVIFVAALKEMYDKESKKGTPELLDFVFTVIPALILTIIK
jgi:peptidoglycan biosynthesis protein MviN/MurJ (putative lipid II flippase)